MSNWFSATHYCPRCEITIESLVERTKRYEPIVCDKCGGPAGPGVGAPALMQRALPDGTNRGVGYDKLKQVAELKVVEANLPRDKRADVQKEIRKLESLKPDGGEK